MQKLPAEEFITITKFTFYPREGGEKAGLMMGEDYASVAIEFVDDKLWITYNTCINARTGGKEIQQKKIEVVHNDIYLKGEVRKGGICQFAFGANVCKPIFSAP